ncbi:MAG TPA: hypothetical protein VEY09_10395 [Pyrinomonadaceae bacterium]|nr:hypothetical protein [Pyrinomonadaceae bacterium]
MKKKIAYFAASFALAGAFTFSASFYAPTSAAVESCQGRCNRAKNACLNTAQTTGEAAQCNKSYQGCISSCK